jgi:hypothetical protein
MAFLSGMNSKGGGGFNWERALLGFFGGPQVAQQLRSRRRAEEEAEQTREAEARRAEAAQRLGISKEQLNAMDPEDVSNILESRFQTRQFGAEGGSIGTPNNTTGEMAFQNAPRSYSDEGRLFQVDPQGNPTQILDARENDVDWQTGQWGAFATDRSGRPIAPGTNIQSPMGGPQPLQQQPQPNTPIPPGVDPTSSVMDPNTIFGRMIQRESGGRQFGANGQPLRSRAGAIGIAQVMPRTAPEAARLAGLPFDAQRYRNDPQYNAALGQAYFQEQLRQFGDPALAVAAYNAGPQRVRSALQRGGQNWIAHVPRETQQYVANVMGGGGTQFAQASVPGTPGQGRSVQDQAATGMVTAPQQAPPGYQWTPQGLAPIPGGPGDQTYQRGREQRQDANQVVQQYRSDPEVQRWEGIRTATMQMQSLGRSGNPADDVAMIFSFMRSLDPNSTVREGEFATAQNTAGVPERLRNYYNQAKTGELLSPNQRQDMIRTAERLYRAQVETYNRRAEQYRAQLQAAGMSPQDAARMVPIARGTEQQFQSEVERRRQGRTVRIISRRPAGQ